MQIFVVSKVFMPLSPPAIATKEIFWSPICFSISLGYGAHHSVTLLGSVQNVHFLAASNAGAVVIWPLTCGLFECELDALDFTGGTHRFLRFEIDRRLFRHAAQHLEWEYLDKFPFNI